MPGSFIHMCSALDRFSLNRRWIPRSNAESLSALELALDFDTALDSALDVLIWRWICSIWRWIRRWILDLALNSSGQQIQCLYLALMSVWDVMYVYIYIYTERERERESETQQL